MLSRMYTLSFVLGLCTSFVACEDDGGDVGAPCNEDGDCEPDLDCDVHEGQGSCQEPHAHGTAHEAETGSESSSGG